MTRHELRELIFKMLFGAGFHDGNDMEASLYNYLNESYEYELSEEDKKFIVDRVLQISSRAKELDDRIDAVSEGWRTYRMGRAELSILRLALYELSYDDEVPTGVAINEAVELAKEYCSDDAPAFINGILAKLAREEEA